MLIKCPECNLQVSDKAFICPHCGYPIKPDAKPIIRKSTKRKRLPNGFGQITELKNRNLRKPFRAMVTVGFNDVGRPISKLLQPVAYFKTYNEAYEALLKYNKNPYTIDSDITLEELFERWYDSYIKTVDKDTTKYVKPAWQRCEPLWNIKLRELRKLHLRNLFDNIDTTYINKVYMKRLLSQMLKYAMNYELVDKNVALEFKLENNKDENVNKISKHKNYTEAELSHLWKHKDDDLFVKYLLIQCYMGWRPSELCEITKDNVNLKEGYIIGGMKTESGKNRKVPIHPAIKSIIKELLNLNDHENLIVTYIADQKPKKVYYRYFSLKLNQIIRRLKMEPHKLHDPRVTFVTLCKKYNVDEYAIKYMTGHTIKDITETTYTRREFDWLQSEIEKIKVST